MDIVPNCPATARALHEYVSTVPVSERVALDSNHRCNAMCTYKMWTHNVAICVKSLHTHTCLKNQCTLSTISRNTAHVCTITGLETSGPAEVRHMAFRNAGSFNKSSGIHWTTTTKRHRITERQIARNVVTSVLQTVFRSSARQDITASYVAKRHAACMRACRGRALTVATYFRIVDVVSKFYDLTRPVPDDVPPELVEYICASIQFVKTAGMRRNLILKQNTACLTFGLLQLFSQGFTPMGVTAVYTVPFVRAYGISPSQFAKLPGLRARQQTIAVRQIQRVCVDSAGKPALQVPPFVHSALCQPNPKIDKE